MGSTNQDKETKKGATKMLSLNIENDTKSTKKVSTKLCIVDQIRLSAKPHNRLALTLGGLFGAFVPAATYTVVHAELAKSPALAALVIGGLLFSAPSVFGFAKEAFQSGLKAFGFVVLLEGTMVFSGIQILGLIALGLLIAVNWLATGTQISLASKHAVVRKTRKHRRVRRTAEVTPIRQVL